MKALVFNCGSSSLKFELIELDAALHANTTLASGKVEEIGEHATAKFVGPDGKESRGAAPASNHKALPFTHSSGWSPSKGKPLEGLDIVAHRVVHGGGEVEEPRIVDEVVYAALERAAQFAPLHNPLAISVMRDGAGASPEGSSRGGDRYRVSSRPSARGARPTRFRTTSRSATESAATVFTASGTPG